MNPPSDELFLHVNGQCWPCRAGDILGRQGTVALEVLGSVGVLSRRHLSIESVDGVWCLVALPESRNDTWLEGVAMERGQFYPLTPMQTLQVDAFQFHLGAGDPPEFFHDFGEGEGGGWEGDVHGQAWETVPPSYRMVPPEDDTHDAAVMPLPPGAGLEHLPEAAVETDVRLNILAANQQALVLLGAAAVGRDLDEWTTEQIRLRNHLLTMTEGERRGGETALFLLPSGSRMVEVSATRGLSNFVILLRDVSDEHQEEAGQQSLFKRLVRQSGTLSELSLSRAFHDGDLPKSLTLLAYRAAESLDCGRVSVWLKPDSANGSSVSKASITGASTSSGPGATASSSTASPTRIVCQIRHDVRAAAAAGHAIDLAYCPVFFDPLTSAEPWAEAAAGTPVMNLLQEIGFAGADAEHLLCVGLQHADGIYGVLCFERTLAENAPWSREDRQFAVCLASYAVLALQTRERHDTMARMEFSEKRLTAELEEAKRYVMRILPEPVPDGPITSEWHMVPSEALGGDSFGYHWVGDLFVMYILDVVGHGTGMALLSISVLNHVRARLMQGEAAMADPAGVLSDLNAAFPMEDQNNMLFSMWYGVYDRRTGVLTYSSAGHPPALLLFGEPRDDGEDYATLGTEGPSVGALAGVEFENGSITVDPGAKLYIYTDGAFEIPLGPNREWSFEEFVAVVRSTRYMDGGEPVYLRKRIGALCALDRFPDDFTVVRLSFSPGSA